MSLWEMLDPLVSAIKQVKAIIDEAMKRAFH